jgi:hypothetical protein
MMKPDIRRFIFLLFAVVLVSMIGAKAAYAACTNPSMAEGAIFYNEDQNVPQVCVGSNWVALGILNPSAGSGVCSNPAMAEGSIFYNDDFDILQYCDGANWIAMNGATGGSGGCGVYSTFVFDDEIDAVASTSISSSIELISTNTCSASVSIAGDGTPEYRICNDISCSSVDHTWASSGNSIDNGQYLQLRLTTEATGNTISTATVTVGGILSNWSVTTAPDSYLAFVTSTGYKGNLGGIGGADKKCRDAAGAAGLTGIFKAWISENNINTAPAIRFDQAALAYRLRDGTKIADNWTDLVDGTLDSNLNVNENNVNVGTKEVWTNTTTSGTYDGSNDCNTWTDGSIIPDGRYGMTNSTAAAWTDSDFDGCGTNRRLYCFQQDADPVGSHKKVFVSSVTYNGNLGGISGADSKCQSLADAASLGGTYKAWLADSTGSDPDSNFTKSAVPYRMVDGTRVADNWTDLTDNILQTGIVLDENGAERLSQEVWTNSYGTGNHRSTADCSDWTTNSIVVDGRFGISGPISQMWTDENFDGCGTGRRLYCFEQ